MDKVRRLVKKAKTNVVGTTLGHTWYWYNDLSAHHKVLASVQLLQHATADLHVMPHNWIGHRINSIYGQKVIHSEQLFSAVDMKCSQFPAKHAKKKEKKKKDVFCFLVTEKRKHEVNFFLSVKIYSALWDKTVPWRDQGKERTHPPLYKMTAGRSKPGQCKDPEQNKSFCSPCAPLHLLYRPYPHTHPLQPPHTQNESWGKRALSRTNS